MTNFANQQQFDDPRALGWAAKGIVSPQKLEIQPRTLIYRYGNDMKNAVNGPWWLDLGQRIRVEEWAVLNRISLPHAIRIMCAVMHEWEKQNPSAPPSFSTMEYLASAITTKPLLAYVGESRPQSRRQANSTGIAEQVGPATLNPPMTQLYIPGLDDRSPCGDLLDFFPLIRVDVSASELLSGVTVPPRESLS